jgi:serine/threonine protein phosphatase 1
LIKFLSALLGKSERRQSTAISMETDKVACVSPSLPPDRRLYCIGDIHGRLDLLEELHVMIREDVAGFSGSKAVVYLGDYIDRGSQSSQVLDLLIAQELSGFETVYLVGNHDQSMLDFLEDPESVAAWLSYGGQSTLLSYGVGLGRLMSQQNVEVLRDELEVKVPQSHLGFLRACRLMYTEGSYCFVHAGIRPGVPLDEQVSADLLWIREEFVRSKVCHEHIVVHGHAICNDVEWLPTLGSTMWTINYPPYGTPRG